MLRQFAPYIKEAVREVTLDIIDQYMGDKRPKASVRIIEAVREDPGQPYRAVTRSLCLVHRYLLRLHDHPELKEAYTTPICDAMGQAMMASHDLPSTVNNTRLITRMQDMEVQLLLPLERIDLTHSAETIWYITETCLELSERMG